MALSITTYIFYLLYAFFQLSSRPKYKMLNSTDTPYTVPLRIWIMKSGSMNWPLWNTSQISIKEQLHFQNDIIIFSFVWTIELTLHHLSARCIMSLQALLSTSSCTWFPFSLPPHTGQAYFLRRYPCFTPTTHSLRNRLRNALRSFAHTVSLRFALGTLLRKRCIATLARCLHVPPLLF